MLNLVNHRTKEVTFDYAKEMSFEEKALSNKSNRDKTLLKLPKSPDIMISGISPKVLLKNLNELSDRLKI